MIASGFFSLFNFIANKKYAQIALTAGVILLVWLGNNQMQRNRGARERDAKTFKRRMEEAQRAEEHITTITQEASNEADQAIAAGNAAARSPSLSDSAIARTLGRNRSSG